MRCSSCDYDVEENENGFWCIRGQLWDLTGMWGEQMGDCPCTCHVDEPTEYGVLHLPKYLHDADPPPPLDGDALLEALIEACKTAIVDAEDPKSPHWHYIPRFVRKGEPSYMPPLRSAA